MKLWFENSRGNERVINENADTWMDVHNSIHAFVDKCNQDKIQQAQNHYGADFDPSKVRPFVWSYTRMWKQEDGRLRIDIGSHSEFFLWEGDIENEPDLMEDIVDG